MNEMKSSNVIRTEKKPDEIRENLSSMKGGVNFDKEGFDKVAKKLSWTPDELLQEIITKIKINEKNRHL